MNIVQDNVNLSRVMWLILQILILVVVASCSANPTLTGDPVAITAVDLQKAFLADPKAAMAEFSRKPLLVTGEVARAVPRTRGTTMRGEIIIPAQVFFQPAEDLPAADLNFVICEGDFDVPDPAELWVVNPDIHVGEPLTVECRSPQIRWSGPGVFLFDCAPVLP
jgi:hypothetical protein